MPPIYGFKERAIAEGLRDAERRGLPFLPKNAGVGPGFVYDVNSKMVLGFADGTIFPPSLDSSGIQKLGEGYVYLVERVLDGEYITTQYPEETPLSTNLVPRTNDLVDHSQDNSTYLTNCFRLRAWNTTERVINSQNLTGCLKCPFLCGHSILIMVQDAAGDLYIIDVINPSGTTSTTTTPATAHGENPCAGDCDAEWDDTAKTWSFTREGCETTTTTTSSTSSTTTPYCTCPSSTTTSPVAGNTCECLYPTYCGSYDGECTVTQCSQNRDLEPVCDASTTTTTTCDCATTSTTTTQSGQQDCSALTCRYMCLPSPSGGYHWRSIAPDDVGVQPYTGIFCSGGHGSTLPGGCTCPDPISFAGGSPVYAGQAIAVPCLTPCEVLDFPCQSVQTTASSGGGGSGGPGYNPPCTGYCMWFGGFDAGTGSANWYIINGIGPGCSGAYQCQCEFPSTPPVSCDWLYVPCASPNPGGNPDPCAGCYGSTTTTTSTTTTIDCDNGHCKYRAVGGTADWLQIENTCPQECDCSPPSTPPPHDCSAVIVPCGERTTTTSTTSTTTTQGPGWYCMPVDVGGYSSCSMCINASFSPPGACSGPYPDSGTCADNCLYETTTTTTSSSTTEAWYCMDGGVGAVCSTSGCFTATSPPPPGVTCNGPHPDQATCEAVCGANYSSTTTEPSGTWYCWTPEGDCALGSWSCVEAPAGGTICSGPYASEAACLGACTGP